MPLNKETKPNLFERNKIVSKIKNINMINNNQNNYEKTIPKDYKN